ncbi:MAG: D-alanyl-D-alanine carboxypeptidase [Clostridia bacterium]|nr:D-alanyl-D-alanine carboxypeptidase [Clostridia bacterium]
MNKRIIIALITVLMILSFLPLGANALEDPKVKYTPYCAVYNIENDEYCYENSIDDRIAPAGTVKIMTAALAIEYYADNMKAEITVKGEWLRGVTGITAGFKDGEVLTAEEVISTLIICSANDSAYILANDIAGSSEAFVTMMNEKAKDLGMKDTLYINPTGTDVEGAYTSVRDVVTISKYVSTFPKYTELSDSPSVVLDATSANVQRTLYSRNYFISYYYNTRYHDYSVFGFNSGMSGNAGWCLSIGGKSSSGLTYIVVVMGARDPETEDGEKPDKFFVSGYEDAKELLNWAYDNFGYFTIIDTSTMVCEVPVKLSTKVDHVIALPEEKIVLFLPLDTDLETAVEKKWSISDKELRAPLSKGEKVGTLTVTINGKEEKTVNLVAKNNVDRNAGLLIIDNAVSFFTHPFMILLGVIILILIVLYIFYMAKYMARKRQIVKYKAPKVKKKPPSNRKRSQTNKSPNPKMPPKSNHPNNNNNRSR